MHLPLLPLPLLPLPLPLLPPPSALSDPAPPALLVLVSLYEDIHDMFRTSCVRRVFEQTVPGILLFCTRCTEERGSLAVVAAL
ncbi:hypothetical protein B0H10DRAFT_2027764 [Mycena sp. CBHHK59/15]|nr:hypothetical protein B0H10DRAFT_2027764 [Mycena sp. CBHHK59/15]